MTSSFAIFTRLIIKQSNSTQKKKTISQMGRGSSYGESHQGDERTFELELERVLPLPWGRRCRRFFRGASPSRIRPQYVATGHFIHPRRLSSSSSPSCLSTSIELRDHERPMTVSGPMSSCTCMLIMVLLCALMIACFQNHYWIAASTSP